MPVQASPPSHRPQSSIQPIASVPAAQVLESPAKQSATLQDLPNELLLNIFERCLPKDMCNFSLASTFCRQFYYRALHTLFIKKDVSPVAEIFLYKYVYPNIPLENHIYTHSSKNKFNWLLQHALRIAIENDHAATAEILLENGAKIGGYHKENEAILPYALQKATPSILKKCLQQYIKQNSTFVPSSHEDLSEDSLNNLLGSALCHAVEKEDVAAVNALLNYGTSIYIQNDDGEILLNKIINEGSPSLVEVFLKKYIHPSTKYTKDSLASLDMMTLVQRALHYAVKNADGAIINLLLKKQAHCFGTSYLFAMVKIAIQNGQRQIAMHISHALALQLLPEWLTWFLINPIILFFSYLRAIFSLEKSHPDCNNALPQST